MKKFAYLLLPLALVAVFANGCGDKKLAKCEDATEEKICTDKAKFANNKSCKWDQNANNGKGICEEAGD